MGSSPSEIPAASPIVSIAWMIRALLESGTLLCVPYVYRMDIKSAAVGAVNALPRERRASFLL